MASQRRLKRTKSEYNSKSMDIELPDLHYAKTVNTPKSRRKRKHKKQKSAHIPITRRARTVPRKLGPRDIGRIKYKGTVYTDNNNHPFLEEKVHKHARSSSFAERKSKNPIKKRERIEQIGTPFGWNKPTFFQEEVETMRRIQIDQWLKERPMKPPNNELDALKSTKAPKRETVSETGTPDGWDSIDYKYDTEFGTFLNEKLWFEGSRAPILNGLSQMIEALPSERKKELKASPSPTGIHSKIKFLKQLRDFIMEQVQLIRREEMLLKKYQSKRTLNVIDNFEVKYETLLKRRNSSLGVSRRKLFTMESVRALDGLIYDMKRKSTT